MPTDQTIIDKLERADGPSDELDVAIAEWCYTNRVAGVNYDPKLWLLRNGGFTYSIDDAMTLVPEGMAWTAGYGQTLPDDPMGAAVVGRNARFAGYDANYDAVAHGSGVTPALALCIASLRAREHG